MLRSLLIKNFILLDEVKLDFTKGFNVLCGETGAGKSIIIKALDCVLGAKVTKEMLLKSDAPCIIEAVFENNGTETTISRETLATTKFRLNGILSNLDEIKELRTSLVDIHSQHQTYSYLQSKTHINLLDDYISKKQPEFIELLKTCKNTYSEYKAIEKKLKNLKENLENNAHEIEFLSFQLKELDDASVKQGEEDELKQEIDILSNVQELKEGTYSSYWALYGDNQSIIEALSKIKYEIQNLSELDKSLEEAKNSLYDAFENLKDTANFLQSYSSNLDVNPAKLDELNERLSLIQKLKRKYGDDLDSVRDEIAKKLEDLTGSENNIDEVEKNYEILKESYNFISSKLEEYRIKNAQELSKLIEEKLKTLELKEAQFKIDVKSSQETEIGKNSVEFLISTNKNQTPQSLSHTASGGEISRVMLALKTIFANTDKVATIVFDEIDTGISGVTSNSVAQSLIELSKSSQIICISHQPIIVAKADNFIWITKTHNDDTTIKIETLNNDRRLEALAQLASGNVDNKSIEFAKTLL